VVTHWIVVTEVCSFSASVCRATLTIVVSKMTAITPTTRISAVLTTFGSSWPAAGAGAVAMTPLSIRDESFSYGE
jgi:hypothetical protein